MKTAYCDDCNKLTAGHCPQHSHFYIKTLPVVTDEFLEDNKAPMDYGKFQYEIVLTLNNLNKKINEIIDKLNESTNS